jgi:hypothetical protein
MVSYKNVHARCDTARSTKGEKLKKEERVSTGYKLEGRKVQMVDTKRWVRIVWMKRSAAACKIWQNLSQSGQKKIVWTFSGRLSCSKDRDHLPSRTLLMAIKCTATFYDEIGRDTSTYSWKSSDDKPMTKKKNNVKTLTIMNSADRTVAKRNDQLQNKMLLGERSKQ